MKRLTHRIGNTFSAVCTLRDSLGAGIDLTTVTIDSQVRCRDGVLYSTAVITKSNQTTSPGKFSVVVADTTGWLEGIMEWDIQYTISGQVSSTELITINAVKGVTVV